MTSQLNLSWKCCNVKVGESALENSKKNYEKFNETKTTTNMQEWWRWKLWIDGKCMILGN